MSDKQKQIDPLPEEFANYEEAAEFWDTHSLADFEDEPDPFGRPQGTWRLRRVCSLAYPYRAASVSTPAYSRSAPHTGD